MRDKLVRRDFLRLAGGGVVGSAVAACMPAAPLAAIPATPAAASKSSSRAVRLASVPTAVEGGILPALLADFEASTGTKVDLIVGTSDVFELARTGQCDLVLSHYGHKHAEEFVTSGWGEWPRTVFSNQSAILGPPTDPARIRGMPDAIEAFARIAQARAPFVVNDLDGQRYVADILWNGAGRPAKDGWFLDAKSNREDALDLAVKEGGYVLWGITPFTQAQHKSERALEALVTTDPLLQRLMVTILVRRDRSPAVNAEGASALQSYLLAASTQAKMRSIKYPGVARSAWAPAGRNNRYAILPHG